MTLRRAPLRVAFMGTPDFALPTLQALAAAGHEIAAVYCQPPRPAGRGQKPRPAPVQAYAEAQGWAVRTPASLSTLCRTWRRRSRCDASSSCNATPARVPGVQRKR